MGQGACGGYLKSPTGHSVHRDSDGQDSNNNKMSEKLRISQLEHMLQQKNTEIEALQVKINIKNSALCSRNFQNVKLRSTIQELIYHSILLEINFGKIWMSKIAIFTISETLNFEIW